MAAVNLKSVQLSPDARGDVRDNTGKVRILRGYYKNEDTSAHDANSTIDLIRLPYGSVRLLPHLCRLTTTAFGASRTLDLGYRQYQDKMVDGKVDEDLDAFISAKAINSAVSNEVWSSVMKYDIHSTAGVTLAAQIKGGNIPTSAVVEVLAFFIAE